VSAREGVEGERVVGQYLCQETLLGGLGVGLNVLFALNGIGFHLLLHQFARHEVRRHIFQMRFDLVVQ